MREVEDKLLFFFYKKKMSDNKKYYYFKLKEANIKYKKTRPYSPCQNGIVERNHILDSKFYENKRFYSLKALKRAVKKYCSRYNNISRKVLGFKSLNQMIEEFKKVID